MSNHYLSPFPFSCLPSSGPLPLLPFSHPFPSLPPYFSPTSPPHLLLPLPHFFPLSSLLQAAIEAQLRQRLDLQAAHHEYMELKARKAAAEKEEEEEFRRQMMAKFAEDDRIEQMNAQKRRMKQLGKERDGDVCQPLAILSLN